MKNFVNFDEASTGSNKGKNTTPCGSSFRSGSGAATIATKVGAKS
jgi:hypothetical protein